MQDVASGMWKPPHVAISCPSQDMAGILHRLENLTGVGFCHLCYALGGNCRCSKATSQAPLGYSDQALWVLAEPSYASMASSMITTTSTSMTGVSPTVWPPPGFPARGVPSPMDVSPVPKGHNLLAHAGVGRGLWPQSAPGSESHEVTPATPYQQVAYPPKQVRFASPVTKTEMATSQSVATRGRQQSREHGGHQEPASHSRARRDRSSTRGPKNQRGITSEDPMDDLMDFIPSGWRRDLIHMVGCFYTSQITPLNSQEWDNDQDKFIWAMDEHKDNEWLDIKELVPL